MKIEELDNRIELAKNWLLYSGIQNLDSNNLEIKGGFNSWINLNDKSYFYTYSEITGYGISSLVFLNKIFKDNLFLSRALLAAEWLLDKAKHKSGGVKSRYYLDKSKENSDYSFENADILSFDNGIVINSLINLYKICKDIRFLEKAEYIADTITRIMQKSDGSLHAIYNHKTESFKDSYEKWSTQSGSFHVKVAMGLIYLYELTKNERYKSAAEKLCESSLKFQKENGRFVTYQEGDTHLHPHCYSAEGLLFAGKYFNNEKYIQSSLKATKWLLDNQLDNGGISSMYVNNEFIKYERSDILAQTLRLGILFLNLNFLDKNYESKLDKLFNRLLEFQNLDDEQKGGFNYGYDINYRDSLKEIKKNHLNSWCTMFALQAIIFYKQYKENNLNFDDNLNLLV